MIDYRKATFRQTNRAYDDGLRKYFLKIYQLMCGALAVNAISAFAVLSIHALTNLMFNMEMGYVTDITPLSWFIGLAPLGISLYFAFGYNRITYANPQILFWVFATLMGMSLSSLGFMYTGASITKTFFICYSMFAGMILYGYSTEKDLTSMGSFLCMGLISLIIASLVNLIPQSPAIEFALSFIGFGIFTGLIAYDTQKLKALYYQGAHTNSKIGIMAAFRLYLDFINLFIYQLRFFGVRRND